VSDSCGSDTLDKQVNFELVSLEPEALAELFSVVPQPTDRWLSLHRKGAIGRWEWQLFNLNGQAVQTGLLKRTEEKALLDLSTLVPGLYFLTLANEKVRFSLKVLKK
jgi:hypothetical protein